MNPRTFNLLHLGNLSMRQSLLLLSAALLCAPIVLPAQKPEPPDTGTSVLLEGSLSPGVIRPGRWVPPELGTYLAASWFGHNQEQGRRLGLMVMTANIQGPLPTSASEGMVRTRNFATLTLERIRLRKRGPWVITTGYGVGVGAVGDYLDRTRSGDPAQYEEILSFAPGVSASADLAWRLPPGTRGVGVSPLDFFIGLRSAALIGVRKVDDIVPSTGEIKASRKIGHALQLAFGVRVGLPSGFFR